MIQRNFVVFTASAFLFLIVFSTPSLIASQENSNKPSFKSSIPQSTIQNLSSTSTGDPKFDKAEFAQKTKKLQIPFIANNGQTDEKVAFYANTFGGTVFVTKDGEIVYSLPNNSPDVETQCVASLMHSPKGIRDEVGMLHDYYVSDIMHPASWIVDHDKSEFQNPKSTSSDSKNLKSSNPKSAIVRLSAHDEVQNPKSGVALKETLVGGRVQEITGNEKAVTKVSYFKGNDPSQWKTNISAYDIVSLGEVYDGIELKLKAYGNNVEKLFCVKPDANPDQIKISLSGIQPSENPPPLSPSVRGTGGCPPLAGAGGGLGARGLWVNEHGELVAETELGPVKFTKPVAYQEINGKRVAVGVEYRVESSAAENKSSKHKTCNSKRMSTHPKSTNSDSKNLNSEIHNPKLDYGFKVASYDKSHDLIIDPLLASTFLGGSGSDFDYGYSLALDTSGNVYVTGRTGSTDFPTTSGAYDTSYNDVFVSKINDGLTSVLASSFLGGYSSEYASSIAIDSDGNIYITGRTLSADFPTTSGAYDTSFNSSQYSDIFVSKLNSNLTNLIASTLLGGFEGYRDEDRDSEERAYSIAIGSGGNIYIAGSTSSTDFPTTVGAYDTSYSGGSYNAFISKLNGNLTSLLASTYLGKDNCIYSIAIDSGGNIYAAGWGGTIPTTTGSYDISNNGYQKAFISKLNGDLTNLLASTYLGGSGHVYGYSVCMAIDSVGNIYISGTNYATDFPTTTGAYDTSFDGTVDEYSDAFVSKLNGSLTSLLASTYLGGSSDDYIKSIAVDSDGSIYVIGYTYSSDFPTTTNVYDTSSNGGYDVFVAKLSSDLTNLNKSTFLGGSEGDYGESLAISSDGYIYVTGYTYSLNFPATTDAYDTSNNGDDIFVSKFDSNLSAGGDIVSVPTPTPTPTPSPTPTSSQLPIVVTGYATSVTKDSATLDGAVNANGLSTTVWFEYGTASGSYNSSSSTQSVNGTTSTTVNINISGLSSGTTYYYRIVAQNSAGTSYGSEKPFKTVTDTAKLPKVTTGSATSVTSNSAKLDGTVNANNLETYMWFEYGTKSGSYGSVSSIQKVTGTSDTTVSISISGLSSAAIYYYRIVAQNNSGTSYGSEKSFTTSDTSSPSGSLSINEGATYSRSTKVALSLSATDNAGVTGYYISTSSTKPSASASGWTSISSTTSYSANVSYTLSNGDGSKTVYIWYKDNSGNVSNSASDSIILDTTTPTINITSPTSDATYTVTSSVIAIGGSASDGTSGVSIVTWSNDKGGNGTASGTTSWLSSSISLLSGENIITVTAKDGAGNTGTDKITMTYNAGTISTPVPSTTSTPTLTPVQSPIPTPTLEPVEKGIISGYVIDTKDNPIESAKLRLKGENSKVLRKTSSDEDGLFEFTELEPDTYIITALKKSYKISKKTVTLEAGEEKDIEIVMKKSRIR